MQDAFAYCAKLVRTADRDRFVASLFAPARQRQALHALYAFDVEIARVRDAAREPLPGEIRLQWWSEVLGGQRTEEAGANPVASALLEAIARHGLVAARLIDLVAAHRFDLYDEPMLTLTDLEAYAGRTSSTVLSLAAQILAGAEATQSAHHAGIASTIVSVLRLLPLHAARRQLYVPIELLERHGVSREDIFAGASSAGLNAALADLRSLARGHLQALRECVTELPREALPAFLAVALLRPWLDRLDRRDAFALEAISPWRRQWLLWRAARNPARIAG